MKVLIADYDYGDVDIERRILEGAGLEVGEAQLWHVGAPAVYSRGAIRMSPLSTWPAI